MRHADDEIERAANRFEQLADELDPANVEVDHTDDLRAIAAVSEAVRADQARLREAVEVARAHGQVVEPDRGRPGGLPASSPAAVHRQGARLTYLSQPQRHATRFERHPSRAEQRWRGRILDIHDRGPVMLTPLNCLG